MLLLRFAWCLVTGRHRYSAIHAHIGGNMAAVASVVGSVLGKPVLVKMAGEVEFAGGVTSDRPSWTVRVRRMALRRADRLQATSTRIASALAAGGFDRERIEVLPNAVDLQRFAPRRHDAPARRELVGPGAAMVGIYVGRLEPEKDPELMVRAWARAFGGDPTQVLLVVGEGTLRFGLQALVGQLGVAGSVRFLGGRRDIEHVLSAADVGLLPSRSEGLSNTLLEYMAAGLPVVGTRVSGTEDFVVTGRNGWLVEPRDEAGFARALSEASSIGDAGRRALGHQARATVVHRASLDAVVARLRVLYAGAPGSAPGEPASPPAGG